MAHTNSGSSWFRVPRGVRKDRAQRSARAARSGRRVAIEPLEGRTLLASNWAQVTAPPGEVGTMMLLTDGTVMAQSYGSNGVSNAWYRLTPSSTGSYVNGTWSTTSIAAMGTARLYVASNVLQNGNVFVMGGEYSGSSGAENDSNTGQIYNTATNTWSNVGTFPQAHFGDDPSILLPNGNVLTGYILGPKTYIYNVSTNTFSATGTKPDNDQSDEEGFVKLANNDILDYEVFYNLGSAPGHAALYDPTAGTWSNTGTVPVSLSSNAAGAELGPSALLPNGNVFQVGGNNNTALYNPTTNTWTAGPSIPGGLESDDAPGVLLPDGQFLFTADTQLYNAPTHVFDYNYHTNTITDITPTVANGDPSDLVGQLAAGGSYVDRFLMLPTGQALFTASDGDLYVYTGTGAVDSSSTPSISGVTSNGTNSYTLTGSALNGASQGATYGDDAEMDTNYPIVSFTNGTTVTYGRSTNWNATGVGVTNGSTATNFTLPSALLSPPVVTSSTITPPLEGQAIGNAKVATFTDPNGNHTGQYSATITWGDGTQSAGTITGPVGGVYTVTGSHTYAEEGPDTISVQVADTYTNLTVAGSGVSSAPYYYANASVSQAVTVVDPPVAGTGGFTLNATAGSSTGTLTLATFIDPGGAEPLSDYTAMVNWGDGSSSAATITGPVNGVFTVMGGHVYGSGGQFGVTITLGHDSATPTVVTDTANVATAVTGVSSSTANGTYGVGKTISIQVAFNGVENVAGTPQLALNSGGTATYSGGSGTSTLTFTYTVAAGDSSAKLDYSSTGALVLNGGTITGPASIAANLTLASPGSAGSLSSTSNIVIDTVAPVVLSYNVLFGSNGSYNLIGSSRFDLPWTITGIQIVFSKPITAADLKSLTGLTTTGLTGLGTNTLTWSIGAISLGSFVTSLLGAGADGITDAAGNYLAGGAGFGQSFKVLLGDVNDDGVVNSADLSAVNLAISQPYNIFDDINGDGVVDINDVKAVRARLGTHL